MKKVIISISFIILFFLAEAMEKPTNFYDLLDLDENATLDEINAAYAKKAEVFDCNSYLVEHGETSEDKKQHEDITEAYKILSNSFARRVYDQEGPEAAKSFFEVYNIGGSTRHALVSYEEKERDHCFKEFLDKIQASTTIQELEAIMDPELQNYYKIQLRRGGCDFQAFTNAIMETYYKIFTKMYGWGLFTQTIRNIDSNLRFVQLNNPFYNSPLHLEIMHLRSRCIDYVGDLNSLHPKSQELDQQKELLSDKNIRIKEYIAQILLSESWPEPVAIYNFITTTYENIKADFANLPNENHYTELKEEVFLNCNNAAKLLNTTWYRHKYSMDAVHYAASIKAFASKINI
jgi:hypothetical protein